ncbi:MAG: DUF1501 domain-containing protein [Verrucomicrobiales bacterium]|nr:DUF1501 domain-containing protein [Verrucomicrobiales bacterium]
MPCQDFTRREFLKTLSAGTLGAMAAGYPRAWGSESGSPRRLEPTADCLIVLWMGGGMAATEMFDPKRYTPFEKGLDPARVLSTFPSIPTKVDGIQFTEGLERLAGVMDRGTLIRTYTAGDLGFILHSRHQFHWHTGYAPPQTVACPHIGAVVSRTLGPRDPAVPAFINIGQRFEVGEGEELKAFTTAGFLGSEYGPFNVPFPDSAKDVVTPPAGMSPGRFENRDRFYRKLLAASPVGQLGSDHQKESLVRSLDNAHRLLSSPAAKAFDLTQESPETVAKYVPGGWDFSRRLGGDFVRDGSYEEKNIQRFGLGCLLARRLVEAGARFIEVTTEYIPFLNWDTHEHGHEKVVNMKKAIDGAISQLVLDLEARGLLDRTLIVLASEFSRDMMQEGKPDRPVKDQVPVPDKLESLTHYGMHRHFTDAGCVLMFGGGIKKGHLHGVTADERPCRTIKDRVIIEDLHATLYRAMGIPSDLAYEIEQRPFYVTRDGHGKAIESMLARGA